MSPSHPSPVVLSDLDTHLDALDATISVWWGRSAPTRAAYTRHETVAHYAASTMKVAVLAALYRAHEAGRLDIDAPVPVRNDFASAQPGAPRFACEHDYDNDDEPWQRIGHTASLRWLAERAIVRSSNLATNVVLAHVGVAAANEVWRLVGARDSVVGRGIEDYAAREAGISNLVTAADLAALIGAVATGATGAKPPGPLASPESCRAMLDVLLAQEHVDDLVAGLPAGTRVAHKNGWIDGVRHSTGVIFPDDVPPYVLAVCTTGLSDDDGLDTVRRVAAETWRQRHALS